jgi:hypothetical protein
MKKFKVDLLMDVLFPQVKGEINLMMKCIFMCKDHDMFKIQGTVFLL